MNFKEAYAMICVCIQLFSYSTCSKFVNFSNMNKLLVNSSFVVVQSTGFLQCAKMCLDYNICSAVSYLRLQLECRLHYFNDTIAPELLVHYDKGMYLSLEDIIQELGLIKPHSCPLNTRRITTKQGIDNCSPLGGQSTLCNKSAGRSANKLLVVLCCVDTGNANAVFDQLKNVAVGKTTYQSSIYLNQDWAHGAKAADAIWDSNEEISGCFHSKLESNPWWGVDLRFAYPVVKIVILNRRVHGNRLQHVFVYAGLHWDKMDAFGTFLGPGRDGQSITLSRSVLKFARIIKIEQRTTGYLQLCEVGIYAPNAEK